MSDRSRKRRKNGEQELSNFHQEAHVLFGFCCRTSGLMQNSAADAQWINTFDARARNTAAGSLLSNRGQGKDTLVKPHD